MGAAQVLIGDVNGDNAVNNFDIDAFVSLLLSGSTNGQCARRFEDDEENRLLSYDLARSTQTLSSLCSCREPQNPTDDC